MALMTALAFVLLVTTSASHVHKSTKAAHDCVLCSVVVDKITDAPVPLALVHHVELQSYRILVLTLQAVIHASPILLPPSCGPPRTSA